MNETYMVAPPGYPGYKLRNRYARVYHVVWWQHTGQIISKDEVIHHKNGNNRDNRFENLELMIRIEHSKLHATCVPLVAIQCANCGKSHGVARRNYDYKKRRGQKHWFCSISCGAKYKQMVRRKLTQNQANKIRTKYAMGITMANLVREYNVNFGVIWSIVKNQTYRD